MGPHGLAGVAPASRRSCVSTSRVPPVQVHSCVSSSGGYSCVSSLGVFVRVQFGGMSSLGVCPVRGYVLQFGGTSSGIRRTGRDVLDRSVQCWRSADAR